MRDSKKIIYCGDLGVGGWHVVVFGIDGICPCIPSTNYKDSTKILLKDRNEQDKIDNGRKCEQGGARTVRMHLSRTWFIPNYNSRRSWILYRTYFGR